MDKEYFIELNEVKNRGTWSEQAAVLNDNFRKIQVAEAAVEELAEEVEGYKALLDSKSMEIGATAFDAIPTKGSVNPVTSDGLHRTTVMAERVIGNPAGDWNKGTAEAYIDKEIAKVKNWVSNTPVTNVVVVDALPASGKANTLYRVKGTNAYSEYGWDGSEFVLLAVKDYGIDDLPTDDSENLVKSGGVKKKLDKLGAEIGDYNIVDDSFVINEGQQTIFFEGDVNIKAQQSLTITTNIGNLISAYRYSLNDGPEQEVRQNEYTLKLTYDVTHLKVRCGTADAISNGTLPVKISKTGIKEDVEDLKNKVAELKDNISNERKAYRLSANQTVSSIIRELYIETPLGYSLPDELYIRDLRHQDSTGFIVVDKDENYIVSVGVLDLDSLNEEEVVVLVDRTGLGLKGYAVVDTDFLKRIEGESITDMVNPINQGMIKLLANNPSIFTFLTKQQSEQEISNLNKEIKEIDNAIYVDTDLEVLNAEEYKENSYYAFNTGILTDISGTYESYLYRINKGEDYRVSLTTKGTLIAKAVYFDENKNYIGYEGRNEISGETYVYNKESLTPIEGAAYVGITGIIGKECELYKVVSKEGINKVFHRYINEEPVSISILSGKKLAAVGDSITHGVQGESIDNTDNYNPIEGYKFKNYMYYIAKANKSKWYNYGISGSTLGDCYAIGASRNGFSTENGRYTKMASDLDYIVLMFGTNDADYGMWMKMEEYVQNKYGSYHKFPAKGNSIGDSGVMTQEEYNDVMSYSGTINGKNLTGVEYWREVYIGSIDDNTNKTWCGAWNIVLPYLMIKYPLAKIIIWLNPTNYVFDESTKAICAKWGIPYIDMHDIQTPTIWQRNEWNGVLVNEVPMNSYQLGRGITKRDLFTADGLHPNNDGYKYIYPIIESKLKSI